MNDWRPAGVETDDDSANFAGSLTFLTLLLTQSLYRASSEVKNQLQKILESLLSSMDLSIVGERCYFFILSNLLEVHMPAHSVLMPPTSLEGRMFGLLAAAGSMISNNGSSPDSSGFYSFFCRMTKTGDTGAQLKPSLYPTLSDLPKSPITPAATHRKQLSYLRKISHLLQSALLHGHIPARDLKLLLIEPYTVEVAKSSTSQSAGAAEEEDTLFTRLTQPIGTLLKKFIPSVFNAPASPTCGNVANADPAHVLAIFSWLRIGNLLSEIEAVAGFSSWSNTSSLEFKDVAELCREVVGLVCSSWRPKAADTQPQYNQESIASFEQRSSLFSSAILFWLLGELASDIGGKTNQLAMPFKGIMPRSINAGLSMPICYTVLTSPTPSEQAQTLCLIRISEAAIWSVLNLAPANFPLHERFGSLRSLFAELLNVQSSEIFIASNGFVHNCLRDGLLLSLFLIGASRLDILQKGSTVTDSLDVLSADLLHWLNTVELRVAADNSHLQLSSFLLFLMLTVKVVSLSRTGKACCDTHPAWTRKSNTVPIQAPSCPNSATVGQLLSTMIGVQQKLVKTNPHDPDKTLKEHLEKLTIFVNCIGSLLERWLGKLDSQAHFDSLDSLGGVCTSEGGKNRDSHIPESHSAEAHAVSPTSSSISSLITRLPNMTLIEACNFTALQFWDNIQPSVKQILLSMEL
ncbi:unnamed protein product [Calicophoron daubneyi]|uniref:Neurochondrin n=1 Tax=Calicophoron daubneyi TaxID=300641 RepID=A0AAV2T246_CALDB